jgi:hypothetical protein
MSRIYRISPQQADVQLRNAQLRSLSFVAVIFVAVVLFSPAMKGLNEQSTLIFLLLMGSTLAFAMFQQFRKMKKMVHRAVETFELEMDETGITKRQVDTETVRIDFHEVTSIEQYSGKGTRIKTAQSTRHIWAPCELEAYDEVVDMIGQRSGAAVKRQSYSWARTYSVAFLFVAGYITLMNTHDRRLVLMLSATMSAVLLWSIVVVWRNPNVSRKVKRSMLLVVAPMIALIARFYQAW